jgi:hypothetical protein
MKGRVYSENEHAEFLDDYYTSYDETMEDVKDTFTRRSAAYDKQSIPSDHFPFGVVSFAQMIWMKFQRISGYIGVEKFSEEELDTLYDSAIDMANYAVFLATWVKQNRHHLRRKTDA